MIQQAEKLACAHIQRANPSLWDGTGKRPRNFNSDIMTYPIGQDIELDISFEHDEGDGWLHLCEVRDRISGELLEMMHGYGIDSPKTLRIPFGMSVGITYQLKILEVKCNGT